MVGDPANKHVPYGELVIAILSPDITSISVHTAINERLKPIFIWQLTSFIEVFLISELWCHLEEATNVLLLQKTSLPDHNQFTRKFMLKRRCLKRLNKHTVY